MFLNILFVFLFAYAANAIPTESCTTAADLGKLVPDPSNCSNFYECTLEKNNHGWTKLSCNPGLYFNPESHQCDFPENVDCKNPPQIATEPCSLDDLDKLKPDPENCSNFYECTVGGWTKLSCYPGLYFNPDTDQCVRPEEVKCKNSSPGVTEPCTIADLDKLIPDPTNCSNFYECTVGGWTKLSCYPGLYFNPDTDQCVRPEEVKCKNSLQDVTEPCTLSDLDKLIPDPTNCSNFYECTLTGWTRLSCFPGLYFNPNNDQCDYPENVNCENSPQKNLFEKDCGDLQLNQLKPDPSDCSKFIQCAPQGLVVLPCPDGLKFNPQTLQCDYPDNVPCGNNISGLDITEPCTLSDLDKLIPDPTNCSNFYECTLTGWTRLSCYPGLYFNPNNDQCDYPENVNCENSSQKNFFENDCGDLPLNQLKPDPSDCSKFIQCAPQGLVVLPCPNGLKFNPQTLLCDYPDNVDCGNNVSGLDILKDCGSLPLNQLEPDPSNCSQFIQCAPQGLVALPCPRGLLFNPSTLKCDYPENVQCANETKEYNFKVESCEEEDFDKLYPDPSDCTRFLQCSPLGLITLPCPSGLCFNSETSQCDYPENVSCESTINVR